MSCNHRDPENLYVAPAADRNDAVSVFCRECGRFVGRAPRLELFDQRPSRGRKQSPTRAPRKGWRQLSEQLRRGL